MLFVVVHADLRPCGFRSSAIQRARGLECRDAPTDRRDQHHGRQHRDDVRTVRNIAAATLTGPITLVLDNARYQHNAAVQALAEQLGITLLFLPSYSPNLNLIERLWKFIKRRALYGRYHPTFTDFQAAIQQTLDSLSTTYAEQLKTLMTLKFQTFEDVSLLAA